MCKSTVDTSVFECKCDKEKPPVDSLVICDVADANYVVHCHYNGKFKFFDNADKLAVFMLGRRLEHYSVFKHVGILPNDIKAMRETLANR